MNIFEKLQSCRVELQETKLNKSGENKFAGYKYFELQDFLPKVNELFLKHKLFSQVSFTSDMATLTVFNIEKPEEAIVFTSPMASAQLKGCHEIQNLGAVQSYQRRYLYMSALEIVEHDALDSTTSKDNAEKLASSKQIGAIKGKALELGKLRGKKDTEVYQALGVSDLQKLSSSDASKHIKQLETWIEKSKSEAS